MLPSLPEKPRYGVVPCSMTRWSAPRQFGHDTHVQRSLAATLKVSLVEAVVNSHPAPSHSCTTNFAEFQVSSPTKEFGSSPPERAVALLWGKFGKIFRLYVYKLEAACKLFSLFLKIENITCSFLLTCFIKFSLQQFRNMNFIHILNVENSHYAMNHIIISGFYHLIHNFANKI